MLILITDKQTSTLTVKNIQPLTDTEIMKRKDEELVSSLPGRRREPPCKRGVTSGLERLDIAF
jgi:hypothetical protein